jgi:hypothetical protein
MRKRIVLNGRNEHNGSPQHFCFDFDVQLNRRGNIEVVVEKFSPSFVPFFRSRRYVFNRDGVCISHLPSKRYRHHLVNSSLVDSHT